MTFLKDPELRGFLHELVGEMERKTPYAAVLLTASRGTTVVSSTRQDRVDETGPAAGAVFTVWNGTHFEEEVTADMSREGLARAARKLVDRVTVAPGGPEVPVGEKQTLEYRTPMQVDPQTVGIEAKLDLCRSHRDRLQGLDPRIVEATCSYSELLHQSLFINRAKELAQEIVCVITGPMIVFADGGQVRYDGAFGGGTGGFEKAVFSEREFAEMAERIPGLLAAKHIEPGVYDLVASPAAAGLVAHEAFGHGVETDMFLKGRARSQQYLHKRVGSEKVNLYDDPTIPGGVGTFAFDDEGQPATKTLVLRQGVFENGLTDLNAAMHLGINRTANGRRERVNKAYARMTNTYFAPGQDRLDDMIAGIDHGFYLGGIESGMEDPKDWGVQCVLLWVREIKDGKLTGNYFTHVGLTGYVPDVLQSVTMVADDLRLFGGQCGKGHKELVRVGMGGPHMKMRARLG